MVEGSRWSGGVPPPLRSVYPMNVLRITAPFLRELHDWSVANRRTPAAGACGVSRSDDRLDLLARHPFEGAEYELRVITASGRGRLEVDIDAVGDACAAFGIDTVILGLGFGRSFGSVGGVLVRCGAIEAIKAIDIVGPRLPHLQIDGTRPGHVIESLERELWSRTIGALGEDAWMRLRDLRVAVVGVGRSGSLVAEHLTSVGVRRIALIDGDALELHNLGEGAGATPSDLGRAKVDAIADVCRRAWVHATTEPDLDVVPYAVDAVGALAAIKRCDIVVSCVDNGLARRIVAQLAALYLKVHVDIGTGIPIPRSAPQQGDAQALRTTGADVRMILPGRCLMCVGGIPFAEPAVGDRDDWRAVRAGSLRSLNAIAVALAMRAIEDLMAGALESSLWVRARYTADGIPSVQAVEIPPPGQCMFCEFAGVGDAHVDQP